MKYLLVVCLSAAAMLFGQSQASLRGTIQDPSAAVIPGASVTVTGPSGTQQTKADDYGRYAFPSLRPGSYTIRVTIAGFVPLEKKVDVNDAVTLDLPLQVAMEKQTVSVQEQNVGTVSVDPSSNAGALVLKGADLDALSDDPDQLSQDLQALAGPSAGPNGGQVFIDGFSGGRMPPKSSIREIRINSNPFSAEYDRMGFGRIEILTKPGTDRFRGSAFFNFSDESLNSRNPFAPTRAPYQSRLFGVDISGPITKKSSFSLDVERRDIDENALVNARILSTDLVESPFQQTIVTPQRRTFVTPRFDYQLSQNHTFTARYGWSTVDQENQGVGQFSLASRAYNMADTNHTFQATETAVVNTHLVNEVRFQFVRSSINQNADNTIPTIQVLDAFTGGGSQIGLAANTTDHFEVTNISTWVHNTHTLKFGARARVDSLSDMSPQNFGGTYTFTAVRAPLLDASNNPIPGTRVDLTSLDVYQRTQMLLQAGFNAAQLRAAGAGPSQFSIAFGNPLAAVRQADVGAFFLDDWRLKPNLTLSYGMRYETQNNISDHRDWAPRLSVAWGIPNGRGTPKTVLRAGFGIFYDRYAAAETLQAERFNGTAQRQYIVPDPEYYPRIPTEAELAGRQAPQAIRLTASSLRAPAILQSAVGVERALPHNVTLSMNYVMSRGTHMLRTRNINAPLPDGTYPEGTKQNVYQFESSGLMRQHQLITNVNARLSSKYSLFGFYLLQRARSDTDGIGTFPAYSYDLRSEWGPAMYDVRHRVFMGGMITAPLKVSFSPFMVASSGAPFNITTGRDANGDSIFNDRPSFAEAGTPGAISTPWGVFNRDPKPGDALIPRNFGRGPAQFTLNLRMMRTWGFGERRTAAGMGPSDGPGGPGGFGGRGPGGGGPGGGGMRGGPGGGGFGMRGGGGRGGMFGGGADTGKRFNITLSISARNILNHVNFAAPDGNLGSPTFGQSLSTAGLFQGPGAGASAAGNRRIEGSLRFTF